MFDHLTEITNNIKKIETELREKVQATAQNEFRPALKEAILILKENVPALRKIQWTQYTPHFNDGDACEFGVHGVYFFLNGMTDVEQTEEWLDNREDTCSFWYDFEYKPTSAYAPHSWIREGKITEEACVVMNSFSKMITSSDELMRACFGDHTEISIDIETGELTQEEYDHD